MVDRIYFKWPLTLYGLSHGPWTGPVLWYAQFSSPGNNNQEVLKPGNVKPGYTETLSSPGNDKPSAF